MHSVLSSLQPAASAAISAMSSNPASRAALAAASLKTPQGSKSIGNDQPNNKLHEKFDAFVGESFYTQMLQAMRKSVNKGPYFHGGRAEEAFQGQLDQVLSQKMAEASAGQFSGPMFDLFNLQMQPGGGR